MDEWTVIDHCGIRHAVQYFPESRMALTACDYYRALCGQTAFLKRGVPTCLMCLGKTP